MVVAAECAVRKRRRTKKARAAAVMRGAVATAGVRREAYAGCRLRYSSRSKRGMGEMGAGGGSSPVRWVGDGDRVTELPSESESSSSSLEGGGVCPLTAVENANDDDD